MSTKLLSDIDLFLARSGMGEYRFGMLAVNNGRLLERLRTTRANGKPARVWPETEAQIRAFMEAHAARKTAAAPSEAA